MKVILILIFALLLVASCNAQSLRLRRRPVPVSRVLKKKAAKKGKEVARKENLIAKSSVKGGGTIKFYRGPGGSILAVGEIKAHGDSPSDESFGEADSLQKLEKKKKPSPVDVFEILTGKDAPKQLLEANRRRLAKKKEKKEKIEDGEHERERAGDSSGEIPNLGCGTFWDVMDYYVGSRNICRCARTGEI